VPAQPGQHGQTTTRGGLPPTGQLGGLSGASGFQQAAPPGRGAGPGQTATRGS
jgi:hypothetical protein